MATPKITRSKFNNLLKRQVLEEFQKVKDLPIETVRANLTNVNTEGKSANELKERLILENLENWYQSNMPNVEIKAKDRTRFNEEIKEFVQQSVNNLSKSFEEASDGGGVNCSTNCPNEPFS